MSNRTYDVGVKSMEAYVEMNKNKILNSMVAGGLVWVAGCGQYNDYVAAPTIVDASHRPPYITSPDQAAALENPTPIYPIPNSTKTTLPPAHTPVQNPDSLILEQTVAKTPERGVSYEYKPDHPEANIHGYIRKTTPLLKEIPVTQDLMPVTPEPKQMAPEPPAALPNVTGVRVIAVNTEPDLLAPQQPHQPLSNPPALTMPAVSQTNPLISAPPVLPEPKKDEPVIKEQVMGNAENTASTRAEELKRKIDANPNDVQSQVLLRYLYLAYGQKEKALELFASFPAEQQSEAINIVRTAMLAAKASEEPVDDTANRAAEALQDLTKEVQEQADLEVAHLEICQDQSVRGFGQYEPLKQSLLESGEPRTVQLYCELKNFKSEQNTSGKYVTQVAASIELIDEDYRAIYQLPKTDIPDIPSHHPRRDFFFRGQIRLPRLPAGKYEIVVRVEDKYAGKIARPYRKTFEVQKPASPPSQ